MILIKEQNIIYATESYSTTMQLSDSYTSKKFILIKK